MSKSLRNASPGQENQVDQLTFMSTYYVPGCPGHQKSYGERQTAPLPSIAHIPVQRVTQYACNQTNINGFRPSEGLQGTQDSNAFLRT